MGSVGQDAVEVLVVGAGPVGLTMAAELARHGVRPRICDRPAVPSTFCRAIGVTPRTLEVWDDMGIAQPMIDAGVWLEGQRDIINGQIRDTPRDLSDLPYATLGIPQYETERLLAEQLEKFGISIERGTALESLSETDGSVRATLVDSAGRREESAFRYVIGCDGAHSVVRKSLGIAIEGDAIQAEFMLGDVHIDWDLPRGISLRAIRPAADTVPEMFIAIPLPEQGRYRVSSVLAAELTAPGTDHGIQSERPSPGIEHLQAIADHMLLDKPKLSDMRWSSIYRISMRLAASYQRGNVFIAGDAAHIHPPLGGQGMNTGIQDAYNLAWKMALVVKGASPKALLDSYESERRAVGQEVIARTTEATVSFGRKGPTAENRLADTQLLVSYRGGAWVGPSEDTFTGPTAGDRAPDCHGLRRRGCGFLMRLFDVLRGTEHVLIASLPPANCQTELDDLATYAKTIASTRQVRIVAIISANLPASTPPGIAVYTDAAGEFQKTYGSQPTAFLVRPDGYLAWRDDSWRDDGLSQQLDRTFIPRKK